MKPLDNSRTAIVATHLQNDFVAPNGVVAALFHAELDRTGVLPTIARILDAARASGVKVTYTRIAFQPGYPDLVRNSPLMCTAEILNMHVEGTEGAEINDAVKPHDGDLVVTHQRLSSFVGTNLDVLLRGAGIDTLAFVGVATNIAIEGAVRSAADIGYRTVIVSDACATHSEAAHNAALESMGVLAEIVTAEDFISAVESRGAH